MSWSDDLSIRMLIVLTMNTIVITSFPVSDDGIDGRQLHQVIPASIRGKIFQVNTTERDASQVVDEDDMEVEENDDEGERMNVDEYEGELRNIAESHEAMFRDGKDNSTDGINHSDTSVLADKTLGVVKNFDSHEKSVEEGSDESMTSNEAISKEPELDMKVKKLLKYKRGEKPKSKRIPSVKKELNTQKEIQESEFDIDVTTDIPDRLRNKGMDTGDHEVLYDIVVNTNGIHGSNTSQVKRESSQQASDIEHSGTDLNAESPELVEEPVAKQLSNLEGLDEYLPARTQKDVTMQKKVRKGETIDYELAESLMDLLIKLAANPSHWERAHRLLNYVEDDSKLSRLLQSNQHEVDNVNHHIDSLNQVLLMKEPESTTKKPKKKKKKKKPLRYQPSTASTITASPVTTTTPMTISSEAATKAHWRVIIDRLFRPAWPIPSNNNRVSKIAGVRYSLPSKPLPSSTSQYHVDNSKYIDKNPAAVIDSDSQYPALRKFHFGRINTHEKGSSENGNDPMTISDFPNDTSDRTNSQLLPYHPRVQIFQELSSDGNKNNRYDQYVNDRSQPFGKEYLGSYQVPEDHSTSGISRYHGYYRKPWESSNHDIARTSNTFSSTPKTRWMSKYELWKSSHQPMVDMEIENNDPNAMHENFESWSPGTNIRMLPWNPINEISRGNGNSRDTLVGDENKNRSKFNEIWNPTQNGNDNRGKQKITMKTWNSLTSDPATWPFKLSDAKPWPTNKDGESFNPNASLVRKLGLDIQSQNTKGTDVRETNIKGTLTKMNSSPHEIESQDSNNNREMWPSKISSKIKSVGAWITPLEQSTRKPYELSQRILNQDSKTSGRPDGAVRGTWNERLSQKWNGEFSMPSSHDTVSSSKWKQFSYHKVNAAPLIKSGLQLGTTQKSRNSIIAMSAVPHLKYPGNEWRKNDIEETSVHHSLGELDGDDPTIQLLRSPQTMQMNQKKDHMKINDMQEANRADPLENQLEDLRHDNRIKRDSPTVSVHPSSLTEDTSTTTISPSVMDGEKIKL